jgi:hypothetical protein
MKIPSWLRSFMIGAGSLFQLAPPPAPKPLDAREAAAFNENAIAGDWRAVGGDMRRAIDALERKKAAERQAELK